MTETAPYWGQLPPPKVARVESKLRHERGNQNLSVDTNMADDRGYQAAPRQNRYSHQTDRTEAPTISTQSPFASPIASEFRGEGLHPRPPSFPAGSSDAAYNRELLEKRKRRESRNREREREEYEAAAIPPAAPDVPSRAPPPLSYKQPGYSNGGSAGYQAPRRSGSTRRSEGPVSPNKATPEEYYRSRAREYQVEASNGKAPARVRDQSERKDSVVSEAEAQRRREWAPDRSPLQRLELTLDSITKEEKRARVEEAELLAREDKAGRGGEKLNENSVRFRNRPVAKAPESSTQPPPQSLPEAGLVRSLSTKQKDQLQRSGTVEKKRPSEADFSPEHAGFEYEPGQDRIDVPRKAELVDIPKRGTSTRDKSRIPVATGAATGTAAVASGLGRSGSNKLRKDPPGDPWFNRRAEAERQFPEVVAVGRNPSTSRHRGVAVEPARDTAFRSHPQAIDKELPKLPSETRQPAPDHAIDRLDLDSADEMEAKPVRRGTASKIEQLTGHKASTRGAPTHSGKDIRTERVTVNGVQYAVPPTHSGTLSQTSAREASTHHHHLSGLLHHHHDAPSGQVVYTPHKRLDEWKAGGVALLSGTLLDLEINEKTEAEKDKAWWEAGNTGRRKTSTKQRKAEAYDGEYDDNNGMQNLNLILSKCEGCDSERVLRQLKSRRDQESHFAQDVGLSASKSSHLFSVESTLSFKSDHFLKPHILTCEMRSIRVRPDIAPTRFKPPLFLKSGPMLRYLGMRKERVKSRSRGTTSEREVWRGSIMIVTQDSQSSYELAPTLRLFLQPTDLLPPPPAQVDGEELAPEYIDPLAGLPKVGRDGRTLYIRPVDFLEEVKDLSQTESDEGLFETRRSPLDGASDKKPSQKSHYDGEKAGKYKEVRGFRLHTEQGVTFWRFNVEIELREKQQRIAYRINRGPATGFWVPARGQSMNIMFHSCNGFSSGVDSNQFCGPDPMWRDVLNTHQTQPFHVMLGGGDQIYNDKVMYETTLYKAWTEIRDSDHKERAPFTAELQNELEAFYLNRYCMWFSQGLFSVAVSQIPMINIFDDHDIIDGFGSYADDYMRSAVFSGLGMVAFKYYMLFQHQSVIDEGEESEPSWILGTQPGPYISELSRSVYANLGRDIAFLGLDCRTERMYDEIVSAETYHKVFDRLEKEIIKGETKHLIVLVGIPVAYPRMVWLENLLTSRAMEPIKALSRAGILGKKLLNRMDGGVEILDDLDDHWTAKHHKEERNWFIQELQDLAAEKSVRVTILGGDVHLGAIGQFYSNPKLGIPKDRDYRYMPNVISSAIVNTPPPDTLADLLNKRNKVHHLDADTDEDMIPIFTHDVNGKARNNKRLLNRRNWCSIKMYDPELTPPPTPQTDGSPTPPPKRGLLRRLSSSRGPTYRPDAATAAPPVSNAGFFERRGSWGAPPLSNPGFFGRRNSTTRRGSTDSERPGMLTRTLSLTRKDFMPGKLFRRNSKKRPDNGGINGYDDDTESERSYDDYDRSGIRDGSGGHDDPDEGYFPSMAPAKGRTAEHPIDQASTSVAGATPHQGLPRNQFKRTPTGLSAKQRRKGGNYEINLEHGLDICLNMEVSPKDPAGITTPYRLLVPALWYEEGSRISVAQSQRQGQAQTGGIGRESRESAVGGGNATATHHQTGNHTGGGVGGGLRRFLSTRKGEPKGKERDERGAPVEWRRIG